MMLPPAKPSSERPQLEPSWPERHYDIHVREGTGLYWKLPDGGITLSADGHMRYSTAQGTMARAFSDIVAIRLQNSYAGRDGMLGLCTITFRSGREIMIYGGEANGRPDETQAQRYCGFMRDLHARLSPEDKRRIAFNAGLSSTRYAVLSIAAFVGFAIFGLLPLGLLLFKPGWETLGAAALAFGLCYGLFRVWFTNTPRPYSPDHLPDDLFP